LWVAMRASNISDVGVQVLGLRLIEYGVAPRR
jgi:hypothetical protein